MAASVIRVQTNVVDQHIQANPRYASLLNEWAFYAPYLVTICLYFYLIDYELRIFFPLIIPISVVFNVSYRYTIDRLRPVINIYIAYFMASLVIIDSISIFFNPNLDYFAIRKISLPLLAISPAIFRFYITRNGMAIFLIILFIVALTLTTQSWGIVSESETDSATESILSIPFGALSVWLLMQRRYGLAGLAYFCCIILFKRNAIAAVPLVVMVGFIAMRLSMSAKARVMNVAIIVAASSGVVLSLFLPQIFDFIAAEYTRGYDAEYISTGRAPIYSFIISAFSRSSVVQQIFGHGPGAVETIITGERSLNRGLLLSHNEYLSFLYDFGIFGLAVSFFMLFRSARGGAGAAATLLYLAIVMTVENIFLITFVGLMTFFLLSAHFLSPEDARARR